jgi:hypothetical protein
MNPCGVYPIPDVIDKEYLQELKKLPRKETIEGWLNNFHNEVLRNAKMGITFCKCDFIFYVVSGQKPYKRFQDPYRQNHLINPDDLLMPLVKKYKNCDISYDMVNTFTIDWK